MEIISSNHGCYFDVYQRSYPPEFHGYAGHTETHVQLADEVSRGVLSEICFQGVRIHYGQFQTLESDTIRTTEDFPSVEMAFQLQGRTSGQSSALSGLAPNQHNLSYRPYADSQSRFEVGDHHYVGIQLTETFFSRFTEDDSPAMGRLLNGLAQKEAVALSRHNLTITPALQTQLIALTQVSRSQPLKRLYLEAAALDLLRQQIDQVDRNQSKTKTTLSSNDIDKILAIKDLLEHNPLDTYSLLQLARFGGLNDYKLKKGFREVIGNTVFGYLNDLRMQYAHQLLRDTDGTIGEVATKLGYSETHHFSAAFKRKFGYLPSQIAR
ncbi:helix-turn-helix transcriptional regulator [Spirosoma sp. KCTC 42546]|uniref:helix-turn-helix transcriptional regulator n=1 Tax=Spirosoma sp. KCTC 42546 TaxID=2520506 RepID=UPI00115770AE|nr:AraC family transcriptional regulator [Spirosoma sp. KCTC 42546]QDK82237.1 helix-turn-helix transcriptional regulator [Spirosoma sp. KCTC 42546]